MATILETINTVTDKIVSLVGTRANKDLSNLTELGEAKLVSGTSGLPVGTVIAYMGTDVPTGYLLMDGRTLSRTTYAALFKVIGTTQGAGDGSTTFGIADMTDGRYLMGSTVAGGSLGTRTDCGLPNIIATGGGAYIIRYNAGEFYYGPFVLWGGSGGTTTGGGNFVHQFEFNAARSSDVYGRTTVVRPKSLGVAWYIKY